MRLLTVADPEALHLDGLRRCNVSVPAFSGLIASDRRGNIGSSFNVRARGDLIRENVLYQLATRNWVYEPHFPGQY